MTTARKRPGIKPDEEAARVVRLMADLYLRGMSLLKICRHLESAAIPSPAGRKRWHPEIVRNIITNPLHAGLVYSDGEYIEGAHYNQRLYDREIFEQIQKEMKSRKRFGPQTLACVQASFGLVAVCDECGDRLRIIRPDDPYRGYRCESTRLKGIVCHSRPYVRGEYLEKAVVREIERIATDPETLSLAKAEARKLLAVGVSDHTAETARLKARREEIQEKWLQLADDHVKGKISQSMLAICDANYGKEQAEIDTKLAELEQTEADQINQESELARVMDALRNFPMLWAAMSPEEKRTTFSLLIESLRVGRGDGCIRVKLKLRFMDEVILDLPIHSIWNKARKGVEKPPIGLRQLAYLALAAEGYSDKQIAGRWKVGANDVRCSRRRAVAQMGASTVAEAIELARPYIAKWREFLPLDSRHGSPGADMLSLSDEEMQALRGIASGKTDDEMAEEFTVPPATIAGRRRRLRDKLSVTSKEALVAKAVKLGIIGPNEPSSALLLRAYKRLASPEYDDLVAQHRLKAPTPRQMQCLQALADGLTAEQAGEKMGVGFQAIVFMRQRLWRIVRADSLRTALEQVQQLGILDWPDIPAEEGKKCQP